MPNEYDAAADDGRRKPAERTAPTGANAPEAPMDSMTRIRVVTHADRDDPPPRPTSPARAKPTMRDLVDRELRGALLNTVTRRPTEAFDNLARSETRPAGKLPERLIEAATYGVATRDVVKAKLHAAIERSVDLVFDGVADRRVA